LQAVYRRHSPVFLRRSIEHMTDDDQTTALDSIQARIAQTATWRRGLIDRYPSDYRNQPAADRLEELSRASQDVREGTWAAIERHLLTPFFDTILNETSREVGFRQRPKDLNAFLVIIADKIDSRIGGAQ
jgi:hypothetical protein